MSKLQERSPTLTLPVPDLKDGKGVETITLHAVWFALLTQGLLVCFLIQTERQKP